MLKRLILIPLAKLFGYRYISRKDCFVREMTFSDFVRLEKKKKGRNKNTSKNNYT